MAVTLSELQRRVFDRMDEGQSSYVTPQQCTDVINEAYALLWGKYVDRAPVLMESDTLFATVPNQRDYLLPTDFRRLQRIYEVLGSYYHPVKQFERDTYSQPTSYYDGAHYRYQLVGSNIRFTPTPSTAMRYFEIWYTPHYTPLVVTSDTLDSRIFPGHEQWIVNQAVIILKVGKEEQPCDDLRAENLSLAQTIENDLLDRDDGANRHIVMNNWQQCWSWDWSANTTGGSLPPGYVLPAQPSSTTPAPSSTPPATSAGSGAAGTGGSPSSTTSTSTPSSTGSTGSTSSGSSTSSSSSGSSSSSSSSNSSSSTSTPPPAPYYIYQNALQNNWRDYSYGTTFDAQPDTRVTGGQARAAEGGLPQYKGFNFNNLDNQYLNVGDYTQCNIDIKCDTGTQLLTLQIDNGDNGSPVLSVQITVTTSWVTYTLPFTGTGTFTNIRLSNFQSATSPRILINNVDLILNSNPTAPSYNLVAKDPNPATTTPVSLAIHVKGNKFYDANNNVWIGRGFNVCDTRFANKAREVDGNTPTGAPATEWKRRVGWAMDMGADWFRIFLDMEDSTLDIANNATYLASIKDIVNYVGSRGGHCMITCGIDWTCQPSQSPTGQPTTASITHWSQIATSFRNSAHVWFGLCNEPQNNDTPAKQAAYLNIVNQVIATIRQVEARDGASTPHMIVVQGVSHFSRQPTFFNSNPATDPAYPITDKVNSVGYLAYEEHNYERPELWNQSPYNENFPATPMQVPMILGEFGFDYYAYSDGSASYNPPTVNNIPAFVNACETNKIPYTAWILDFRDYPAMMVDNTNGYGYGAGTTLQLTPSGTAYINLLRQAKGISGSVNSLGQVQ